MEFGTVEQGNKDQLIVAFLYPAFPPNMPFYPGRRNTEEKTGDGDAPKLFYERRSGNRGSKNFELRLVTKAGEY